MSAFKDFWSALAMPCREASRLQSEQLDHALSGAQRFGLRLHLLYCTACRRYGRHLRFLRHSIQENPDKLTGASPEKLSDAAKVRIKEKLKMQP